ncbi:C39 family peptidase, partial [Ligilactobacillus salivarius]|uniref:C39 family peptidase n=1 Tax=Ligilactobacillus salivarius TaxID=1624 RepID=UPI0013FA6A01
AMKTGVFYNKETGTLQYYGNNGQMNYGNVVINGKVYAFDAAGNYLGKGNVTIDGHDYYLGNNNQVLVGFQKISNNTYYYNKDNGQKEYGQKNIDGSWYMFDDKTGIMKTGFVTIPSQNKTVYYGNNGQMQYGVFRVGKITYTADHISGAIIGVYNDAEVIGQNPELPTGCEITAVTMMLRYAGANINKIQLANEMPRSNNGDYGFVGNPFSVTGWWVFPTGVAPVVNKHLGHSQVMTGASLESIKNKLLNGHLVVAWVANMNGFVNHAIALTGYNGNTLYYNNPWTARKESMSVSSFYTHWNADKQRALSY